MTGIRPNGTYSCARRLIEPARYPRIGLTLELPKDETEVAQKHYEKRQCDYRLDPLYWNSESCSTQYEERESHAGIEVQRQRFRPYRIFAKTYDHDGSKDAKEPSAIVVVFFFEIEFGMQFQFVRRDQEIPQYRQKDRYKQIQEEAENRPSANFPAIVSGPPHLHEEQKEHSHPHKRGQVHLHLMPSPDELRGTGQDVRHPKSNNDCYENREEIELAHGSITMSLLNCLITLA